MPVMETIRGATDSTAMKLVFGAIVLVFVFWGVGATVGATTQTIAEVNGQRITDTELQRIMRDRTRSSGGTMDEDETNVLAREVIQYLIAREVMEQEAAAIGIHISDEEVGRAVLRNDGFKGPDGKFSVELYERTLKRYGMSRGKYEADLRRDMTVQALVELAESSVTVSDAELKAAFEVQSTQIGLTWVRIPDSALLDDVPVDDAAIDALITANPEDIKARYEADKERLYSTPRRVDFSVILLRSDMENGQVDEAELTRRMDAIVAESNAGADFGDLARKHSEDRSAGNGGAMGMQAEAQLDGALAEALFAAEVGGLTSVVQTGRGLHLMKVNDRIDAEVTTYEEAERDIAREMIAERGVGKVAGEYAEKVLAEWKASGSSPSELLAEQGLSVDISPTGSIGRMLLPGVGPAPELEAALTKVTATGVVDGVFPVQGGRLVASVSSYTAADMDLFEDGKKQLRAQMLFGARNEFTEAWRDDLVARARVNQLYFP